MIQTAKVGLRREGSRTMRMRMGRNHEDEVAENDDFPKNSRNEETMNDGVWRRG